MPVTTAAPSFLRPKTTMPSSAGASKSSQPMRAWPNAGCWRLGNDLPAAIGLCTCSSVFEACCTLGVAQTSRMSRTARQTSPMRIDDAGAIIAIAEAAARQASAISAAPAAFRTRPLASHAANHKPAAIGGQSHQRGLALKIPPVAAMTGVPKVAIRARTCGPCGTRLMMSTPAPSSAAGTASHTQLRPEARAWRAGAATVAACAAQSTAYDGTKESVIPRVTRPGPGDRAPRAGSGFPRA